MPKAPGQTRVRIVEYDVSNSETKYKPKGALRPFFYAQNYAKKRGQRQMDQGQYFYD
jgi:hypothetical protein